MKEKIIEALGYEPENFGELDLSEVVRVCNALQISVSEFCRAVGLMK